MTTALNVFNQTFSCLASHLFKSYQNPIGQTFESYCCDAYTGGSWTKDYISTSSIHPEFPKNWVYNINSSLSDWVPGSGVAYGTLVDYDQSVVIPGSTNNQRGLVPALMRNIDDPNLKICCETPLIQDRDNFKCCATSKYSISEMRCCPDLHELKNDKCMGPTTTVSTTTQISKPTTELKTTTSSTISTSVTAVASSVYVPPIPRATAIIPSETKTTSTIAASTKMNSGKSSTTVSSTVFSTSNPSETILASSTAIPSSEQGKQTEFNPGYAIGGGAAALAAAIGSFYFFRKGPVTVTNSVSSNNFSSR